ncbi:MAG: FecR family protein [Bacteroidales bacterium]
MIKQIPWNLIISRLKDTLSAEELIQWKLWINKSENQALFVEIQSLWNEIQSTAIDYKVDTEACWAELQKRISAKESPLNNIFTQTVVSEEKPLNRKVKLPLRKYIAVASVVAVILLSGTFYLGMRINATRVSDQTYTSWVGKSEIILPDATNVWIHSNTTLSYNTKFSSKNRIVNLSGQACFDVTHDKKNPFIVQAGDLKVVVHGTKFNVEALPENEDVVVSLQEGAVSIETGKQSCYLHPGEVATYNKRTQIMMVEQGDVDLAVSWADDERVFNNMELGQICKYLSKWYNVKIKLDDRLGGKYKFTFKLRSESLDEILRIMSRIQPIQYSFDDNNVLTLYERSKSSK